MFRLHHYSLIILFSSFSCCLPQIVNYSDDYNSTEPEFIPRVVNGFPAELEEVPYQLAFKKLKDRRRQLYATFCGGAIIGPSKMLTAAHCFENKGFCARWCKGSFSAVDKKVLQQSFVVAGVISNMAKYGENGQWRNIKAMYLPIKYKFPKDDIAVGVPAAPFVFNSQVASIPYAKSYHDYVGTCRVSGYGRTSDTTMSKKLLKADLQLIPSSRCSQIHQQNMKKFICTSAAISDVHMGDSGGPLVCVFSNDRTSGSKGVLVGIVSGNRKSAGSFFTRVSSYKKFIHNRGSTCRDCDVFLMCLLYGILLF